MEAAFPDVIWFERHPEMKDPVVAIMHMEHLGELEYKEVGEKIERTGLAEHAVLWTRNNPILIDAAITAEEKAKGKKAAFELNLDIYSGLLRHNVNATKGNF